MYLSSLACTQPIIFFLGSQNNIGTQSAVSTPIPIFLSFVTIASPIILSFTSSAIIKTDNFITVGLI